MQRCKFVRRENMLPVKIQQKKQWGHSRHFPSMTKDHEGAVGGSTQREAPVAPPAAEQHWQTWGRGSSSSMGGKIHSLLMDSDLLYRETIQLLWIRKGVKLPELWQKSPKYSCCFTHRTERVYVGINTEVIHCDVPHIMAFRLTTAQYNNLYSTKFYLLCLYDSISTVVTILGTRVQPVLINQFNIPVITSVFMYQKPTKPFIQIQCKSF